MTRRCTAPAFNLAPLAEGEWEQWLASRVSVAATQPATDGASALPRGDDAPAPTVAVTTAPTAVGAPTPARVPATVRDVEAGPRLSSPGATPTDRKCVMVTLPPFPVDDGTLDLLWRAMHPGPEADRSSMGDLLRLMSELGGSDTEAVAEVHDDGSDGGTSIVSMRDPHYHDHDVIAALVTEVRRLRRQSAT